MSIMGTFWLLASAHEAAAEGGFGLNLDFFETNVINLAIVIGLLFYLGQKVLGNILAQRRAEIEEAIADAERRQKEAAAQLADREQKLAQAQAEAERIKAQAAQQAEKAREAILAQAEKDLARLKAEAGKDLNAAQERAIAELRQRVTAMALERAESQLKTQLDEGKQQKLIDNSIAMLGGSR